MMHLFLRFEIKKVASYFKTKTLAKIITGALFIGVLICIALGIYAFFMSGFRYINMEATADIRSALTLFIYEVFLAGLALLVIFSSTISGIFNLFRGGYNTWLISSPGYRIFPRFIFLRTTLSTSLLSLVLFLPAVIAFSRVNHLGTLSIIFILVSIIVLLIGLNALTLSSMLLAASLYERVSRVTKIIPFSFKGMIGLIIAIIIMCTTAFSYVVKDVDLVKIFRADEDSTVLSVTNIAEHFRFLPTHPFAMEILNWQNGHTSQALMSFSILLALTLLMTYIWEKIMILYYPLWQRFREGAVTKGENKSMLMLSTRTYHFTGGRTLALFKKEALVSSRNFKGVMWFLFLTFIWLMQIGANVILSHSMQRYQSDISQKIIILQTLQYIIAIYFLSSFALRFVFPAFSVEKRTAWILASAPLSFKKIFFGKYIFYVSFFVILGILMNYINDLVLGVSFTHGLYSMLLFISTAVFILTTALALGALFPNTETDDPEVISTSMPGLFFTAFALMYGALSDWILYNTLHTESLLWLYVFMTLTLILIGTLLVITPKLAKHRLS